MVQFGRAVGGIELQNFQNFYRNDITEETFWRLSWELRIPGQYGRKVPRKDIRLFRSLLGVSPLVCVDIWGTCAWPHGTSPRHLMWALLFLKVYATEDVLCSMAGCCRATFRKWMWPCVEAMAKAKAQVVSLALLARGISELMIHIFSHQSSCLRADCL